MSPCLHDRQGLGRTAACPICGERKPVSASEVKLARTCWRKWAFRYASAYPKPEETQAMRDGTQLHALLETYLKTGARPDPTGWMGELACAGIDSGLLPGVGAGRVEEAQPTTIDGIPFVVIRDWYERINDTAYVIDHKTSSNPTRYAIKSNEERLDDPQHLLYGALPVERVDYRWIYYPTKGRGSVKAYDGTLTRAEIRGGLERVVLPVAERAYRLREQEIDPNSLDANLSSCMLYNRPCEYTAICDVNRSTLLLTGLAPEKDEIMTMPSLFASLPPVNGAPAVAVSAPATPTAPVQTPFAFSFPAAAAAQVAQASVPVAATPSVQAPPSTPTPIVPEFVQVTAPLTATPVMTYPPEAPAPVFSVTVSWNTGRRYGNAAGDGATLDDAIQAALSALPR